MLHSMNVRGTSSTFIDTLYAPHTFIDLSKGALADPADQVHVHNLPAPASAAALRATVVLLLPWDWKLLPRGALDLKPAPAAAAGFE